MTAVTQLLSAIDKGDESAAHELLPLVYEELRRLAGRDMASQPSGHTLQVEILKCRGPGESRPVEVVLGNTAC